MYVKYTTTREQLPLSPENFVFKRCVSLVIYNAQVFPFRSRVVILAVVGRR